MDKIFFLSDAHLGAENQEREREKENRLLSIFEEVKKNGKELYILGDLFDFFFEYRTVIPSRHYRVIERIADLVQSGVRVSYIVGNHDYWLGSFFREELGVMVSQSPLEVSLQGRRLYLCHGDDVGGSTLGDRVLKRILRSSVTIRLFSWIHPDVGASIARWVSGRSRENTNSILNQVQDPSSNIKDTGSSSGLIPNKLEVKIREVHEFAKKKFLEGFDGVVSGHIHLPKVFEEGDKTLIILGDWFHHFSYGVLNNGELSLHFWRSK